MIDFYWLDNLRLIFELLVPVLGAVTAILVYYQYRLSKNKGIETVYDSTEILEIIKQQEEASRSKFFENISTIAVDSEKLNELIYALDKFNMQSSQLSSIIGDTDKEVRLETVEKLISEYHNQALEQANIQFLVGVVSGGIGFIMLIFAFMNFKPENWITIIGVLPGAIMDTVALLFYSQVRETRERATTFYDRLRSDNQQTKAIKLVNTIENEKIGNDTKARMAVFLMGIEAKPDIEPFLSEIKDQKGTKVNSEIK